ncbi:MAG: hypothetical protein LBU99_00680 [Spirochaetaceae bacterium]|jgi:hypothetical protein|nr:hypothetical protein [Spirochaetaceae bacterium]
MKIWQKMMKQAAWIGLILILSQGVFAQAVDAPELESVGGQTIEFINYTGPQSIVNSMDQIRTIGNNLGQVISAGGTASAYGDRYRIIHAVDPAAASGFDADILILEQNAGVDHIRNLRAIIAAYLSSVYGYEERDAATLATFITVYNAVYRGNLGVFTAKYTPAVVQHLTAEAAGLSTNYADWPGKSQIVIPLSPGREGTLSAIDTSTITDDSVTDSMRQDEGMGLDDRKDMVDLKEREAEAAQERADEAQQTADTAQEQANQAQQRQDEAQTQLDQTRQEAEQARETADQAAQQAADEPDNEEAQQQASQTEQAAQQAEEQVQEQEQAVAEREQETQAAQQEADQAQEAADQEQNFADQKQEEAQAERVDIAQDQQQIIAKEDADRQANANASPAYALKVIDTTELLSELVVVDLNTGKTMKESPVNSIRGRTIYAADNGYIAVAGTNTGNGAIRLVTIDSETLDITGQSNEDIADQAVLVTDGTSYFTVIKDGESWAIGKYSADLQLQNKSAIKVVPQTAIVVTDNGLFVQNDANALRLLRTGDLVDITQQ